MSPEPTVRRVWERWLGVGIAGALCVLTLVLAATGQLDLFINPENTWFVVTMSIIGIVIVGLSFGVRVGAEEDHGHDHGHSHDRGHGYDHGHDEEEDHDEDESDAARTRRPTSVALVGGVLASAVAVAALFVHPSTLSVDLAISRTSATPALFGGEEVVTLARSGDTASFGIPAWSTVFATATAPQQFVGDAIDLTGFITPDPDDPGAFLLTRLVITHCVIDAQPATLPVAIDGWSEDHEVGTWVRVEGSVAADGDALVIRPATITEVAEPEDPYVY